MITKMQITNIFKSKNCIYIEIKVKKTEIEILIFFVIEFF